jgi:hypothetical protein
MHNLCPCNNSINIRILIEHDSYVQSKNIKPVKGWGDNHCGYIWFRQSSAAGISDYGVINLVVRDWIKKATGLGVTEFILRYMAWLCLNDDSLKGSQMCIVTGPREDLAIELIKRMKGLFSFEKLQK